MRRTCIFFLLTALLAIDGLVRSYGQNQGQAPRAKAVSAEENKRLLATGKKLFVERCASCHNAGGDKPLDSGPPLNERKLSEEKIARSVSGRFKSAPEEQKRAVALYIKSFLKTTE